MLDQQVVRAALKAYDALVARKTKSTSDLTPSSAYLRLLVQDELTADTLSSTSWEDPRTAILLLEERAAAMVQERAKHRDAPDASSDHRVARAVVDAFVAVQVGENIRDSESVVGGREAQVLKKLYLLVSSAYSQGILGVLTDRHIVSADYRGKRIGRHFVVQPLVWIWIGGCISGAGRSVKSAASGDQADLLGHPSRGGWLDGWVWLQRLGAGQVCVAFSHFLKYLLMAILSALGQYDGNAYEEMWKRVQSEPLNKTEVPDGYEVCTLTYWSSFRWFDKYTPPI